MVSTAGTYGRRIEPPSKAEKDGFSPRSYWWLFRDLSDKVEADRKHRNPMVREAFDTLEKEFEAGVPDVVKKAVELRRAGQDAQAARVLDDYSIECLNKVLVRLAELRSTFP
jgi:dipeptidase